IVLLDQFPLTSNGKIDKKALPEPDMDLATREYVPPRNPTEHALAEIWQHLLSIEKVGVYDNFFELGGHSLLINKLVSLIKKQFNLAVPIPILFRFTCISDLSNYIEWEISSAEEQDTSAFEVIKI
ncbi:MAG: phosphopantetheine-binding protein, partial [Ferruginibacter sp.]